MTTVATVGFIVSAVLVAMACVKSSRVRAWRHSLDPSAPRHRTPPSPSPAPCSWSWPPSASTPASTAWPSPTTGPDGAWSDDELTSAVRGATAALDGAFEYGDVGDDGTKAADFDDQYATRLRDEIVEHGGGDAPQFGVGASPTQASCLVSATGTSRTFCLHVTRTHTDDADTAAPGVHGDADKVTTPIYTYVVSSRVGEC